MPAASLDGDRAAGARTSIYTMRPIDSNLHSISTEFYGCGRIFKTAL